MASIPTYTRGQFAQAVCNELAKPGQPGNGSVAFFTGWSAAEMSVGESKIATYNCLNMENGQDIAIYNPTVVNGNGIVAFKHFSDGVAATASRIGNSSYYGPIVAGVKNNTLNPRELSSDTSVLKALGVWVNGPNGGPASQSYVNNIIGGSGNTDALYGVAGDTTISNQDAQGNQLPGPQAGSSYTGPSAQQIVKIAGGALLVLAGVALLIKSLAPGAVAKVLEASA